MRLFVALLVGGDLEELRLEMGGGQEADHSLEEPYSWFDGQKVRRLLVSGVKTGERAGSLVI